MQYNKQLLPLYLFLIALAIITFNGYFKFFEFNDYSEVIKSNYENSQNSFDDIKKLIDLNRNCGYDKSILEKIGDNYMNNVIEPSNEEVTTIANIASKEYSNHYLNSEIPFEKGLCLSNIDIYLGFADLEGKIYRSPENDQEYRNNKGTRKACYVVSHKHKNEVVSSNGNNCENAIDSIEKMNISDNNYIKQGKYSAEFKINDGIKDTILIGINGEYHQIPLEYSGSNEKVSDSKFMKTLDKLYGFSPDGKYLLYGIKGQGVAGPLGSYLVDSYNGKIVLKVGSYMPTLYGWTLDGSQFYYGESSSYSGSKGLYVTKKGNINQLVKLSDLYVQSGELKGNELHAILSTGDYSGAEYSETFNLSTYSKLELKREAINSISLIEKYLNKKKSLVDSNTKIGIDLLTEEIKDNAIKIEHGKVNNPVFPKNMYSKKINIKDGIYVGLELGTENNSDLSADGSIVFYKKENDKFNKINNIESFDLGTIFHGIHEQSKKLYFYDTNKIILEIGSSFEGIPSYYIYNGNEWINSNNFISRSIGIKEEDFKHGPFELKINNNNFSFIEYIYYSGNDHWFINDKRTEFIFDIKDLLLKGVILHKQTYVLTSRWGNIVLMSPLGNTEITKGGGKTGICEKGGLLTYSNPSISEDNKYVLMTLNCEGEESEIWIKDIKTMKSKKVGFGKTGVFTNNGIIKINFDKESLNPFITLKPNSVAIINDEVYYSNHDAKKILVSKSAYNNSETRNYEYRKVKLSPNGKYILMGSLRWESLLIEVYDISSTRIYKLTESDLSYGNWLEDSRIILRGECGMGISCGTYESVDNNMPWILKKTN